MLQAKNLTKTYGEQTALNSLNLTINEGEIFALLGQNGAGKTTTINCFWALSNLRVARLTSMVYRWQKMPLKPRNTWHISLKRWCCTPISQVLKTWSFFIFGRFFLWKRRIKLVFEQSRFTKHRSHTAFGGLFKRDETKVGIAIAIAKKPKPSCSTNPLLDLT